MKSSLFLLTTITKACLLSLLLSAYSWSGVKPQLLVVGIDSDADSVPRSNRVFERVEMSITEQMHQKGFDVFHTKAVATDYPIDWNQRMSDGELIDIARSIGSVPINVIVLYSVFIHEKKLPYTRKVTARVQGRMLNVGTGQNIGSFESNSPANWTVPLDCSKQCYLEQVGNYSKTLSADLGAVLADILSAWTGPDGSQGVLSKFTLFLDGFSVDETYALEEKMINLNLGEFTGSPLIGENKSRFMLRSELNPSQMRRALYGATKALGLNTDVRASRNAIVLKRK